MDMEEPTAESEPRPYMLVPSNPNNMFNDPWNIGLYGGMATGLSVGYLLGGKVFPFMRQLLSGFTQGQTKLALVVNADLKMGKGKVASQCSHASVEIYKKMLSPFTSNVKGKGLLRSWEMCGQPKVVMRADNTKTIMALEKVAKEHNLPVCKILDAGKTQVAARSLTVLAIGPGNIHVIDSITGHLRLL